MSTQPQQVDFNEYRQHMSRILGEKELLIAEAGLQLAQLGKRAQELEAEVRRLSSLLPNPELQ